MTKNHINEISEIEKQSFSLPWSEQAFEESMTYEHAVFLVAVSEETGEAAGYIGMYRVFNEGDITNIAVAPKYRGMGIGTKLMEALIKRAAELGLQDIILEVRESNSAAIDLYKKSGFEKIGIRKNFYEKPVEDAMIMHLKVLPL